MLSFQYLSISLIIVGLKLLRPDSAIGKFILVF